MPVRRRDRRRCRPARFCSTNSASTKPRSSRILSSIASRPTTRKLRFVSEHFSTHLLRADWEIAKPVDAKTEAALIKQALKLLPRAGAVVLSDYAKGVLTPKLIRAVIERAKKLGKPVVVDPKGIDYLDLSRRDHHHAEPEGTGRGDASAGRIPATRSPRQPRRWRGTVGSKAVLVTLSEEGMMLYTRSTGAGPRAGLSGEGARRLRRGRHGRGGARGHAGGRGGFRVGHAGRQRRGLRRGRQERHRDGFGGGAAGAHPARRDARARGEDRVRLARAR